MKNIDNSRILRVQILRPVHIDTTTGRIMAAAIIPAPLPVTGGSGGRAATASRRCERASTPSIVESYRCLSCRRVETLAKALAAMTMCEKLIFLRAKVSAAVGHGARGRCAGYYSFKGDQMDGCSK